MMIWLFTALISCLIALPVRGESETAAFLPPELPWSGESLELVVPADHEWATPFERSGLERSPRYEETVAWLRRLVKKAPELEMVSIGKSAEGRDIWMVVASREGGMDSARLANNGRPTLLVQAGIHSGEIDGKDAGMMLLRDMTVRGTGPEWLDQVNLLFIPILSVDGHERSSRFGRINQRGPVEMGWRTNARNLNLNRDYAKLETEELQALAIAVEHWRPDLYLDLHVTDGADYQYDITYGYNEAHAWSPNIARWLDDVLTPAADSALERMGHVPGKLTFTANDRDMTGGTVNWTAPPRFSTGWGDARHLPTVLVENHSLKPFRQRVLGTYVFLEAVIGALGAEHEALRDARALDESALSEEVVLSWNASDVEPPPNRSFRGVRSELYDSPITGTLNVRWTGETIEEEVAVIVWDRPGHRVRRPGHYYIPSAWYPVVDRLRLHGIRVERVEVSTTAKVEMYRLPTAALDVDSTPFEGRARYTPGEPLVESRDLVLEVGSYRVATDQPLGTLAVLLLEPQAPDSFFQWGYFASILQRTEYVEGYVMEPMARAMLDEDPELRAEFEGKLLADAEFSGSGRERLQWFYERTPFYDPEYRLYPVARSVD
jgi:hypothetical protein